jgi:hypothetical protein
MSDIKSNDNSERDEFVPLITKEIAKDLDESNSLTTRDDLINKQFNKRRISVNNKSLNNNPINDSNYLKPNLKRLSQTFVSTETQLFDCVDEKPLHSRQSKSFNFDQNNGQSLKNCTNESQTNDIRNVCSDSDLYTVNELSHQSDSQTKVC